jgi:hypothetical protein
VLGIVSAGDASVDATNRSEEVDVETGNSNAENVGDAFVGLAQADDDLNIGTADIDADDADNVQQGDNDGNLDQTATASSGDGVAGQVAGVVTSAGGSADLVLANTSLESGTDTGSAEFFNTERLFVGLAEGEDDINIP